MGFAFFLRNWLQHAAEAKLRETVMEAARKEMAAAQTAQEVSTEPGGRASDVGLVFALGRESGGMEDLLRDAVHLRGERFSVRLGTIQGRRVALAVSGAGQKAAARVTDAMIFGHQPRWVISAGFCGGLVPDLKRYDIVVADRILNADGTALDVEVAAAVPTLAEFPRARVGGVLTASDVVQRPRIKRALGQQYNALAVDMESLAVAEACARHRVPFLAIRIVSDSVDEELPSEVSGLVRQKTTAGQLGAALASVWNRPGSIKDMYRLREHALVASDRLARFLAALIPRLAERPALPPG